ncbi:hypothetical protein ACH4TX_13355 [Streptomyces sp. NPDC021098]|uniref:hypothetical protein n=1 Tax=unclassified Streptomyces TaxID=2593676 RepID=UPI0037A469F2
MNRSFLEALSKLMTQSDVAAQDLTTTGPSGIGRPIMQMAASVLSDENATADDLRAVGVLLHCTLGDALQTIEDSHRTPPGNADVSSADRKRRATWFPSFSRIAHSKKGGAVASAGSR